MSDDNSQIIFDLSREDYDYKGVLFAIIDNAELDRQMKCPFPTPKDYIAGIMGVIWTDETGRWHDKMRIKYPSGNKQVIICNFDEEFKSKTPINETYVLQHLYKMPMVDKVWTKNPGGTSMGIVKIIQDLDMIESMRVETIQK